MDAGLKVTLAHPAYGHRLDGTYPDAAEKQKAICAARRRDKQADQ